MNAQISENKISPVNPKTVILEAKTSATYQVTQSDCELTHFVVKSHSNESNFNVSLSALKSTEGKKYHFNKKVNKNSSVSFLSFAENPNIPINVIITNENKVATRYSIQAFCVDYKDQASVLAKQYNLRVNPEHILGNNAPNQYEFVFRRGIQIVSQILKDEQITKSYNSLANMAERTIVKEMGYGFTANLCAKYVRNLLDEILNYDT